MIRFATLYSGSSGNSSVIWDETQSILVDLGGSCRRTVTALNALGLAAGAVVGSLVGKLNFCMGIGMLIGLIAGTCIHKNTDEENK